MITVGIAQAKAKLSSLLELVAAGEVVTITKNGIEVARLVPPLRPVMGSGGGGGSLQTITIGAESTPAPRNPAPTHPSPPKPAAAPQRPGMTFIELLQKVAK